MGYALTHRRAVAEEAARRAGRHKATWAEARAVDAEWRATLVPPAVAAMMLGISRRTLDRYVAAGRIERVKLAPSKQAPARFRRRDIDAFKAALLGEPAPSPEQLTGLDLELQPAGLHGALELGPDQVGEAADVTVARSSSAGESLGERGPERIERLGIDASERDAGGM